MKAIQFNAIITSIRSKVDKSLSLTMHTPELSVDEKARFMEYQGINSEMFLKPLDETPKEIKIDKDLDGKTQSQRLRNAIYRLWMLKKESDEFVPDDFYDYYRPIMEAYIEKVKQQMEDYE